MKKKCKPLCIGALLMLAVLISMALTNCASSDNDEVDSLIIGTWELKKLCCLDTIIEVSPENRDKFVFSPEGKVMITKRFKSFPYPYFPNEDGAYDYSYNKEEKIIQFYGKTRQCLISDGEMRIEGHFSAYDGPQILWYIFIKKQN